MRAVNDIDFDAIYDIYTDESVNEFMSYPAMSKDEFKTIFADMLKRTHFWVFEDEGQAYGMCSIIQESGRADKVGYLGSLGVKSGDQGKGYGKHILGQVEEFLKSNGFKLMYFFVESDNERGIAFYEKLGFKRGGTIPQYFQRPEGKLIDEYIYYKTF